MKNILLILFFCVGFNVNGQVPDLLLASKQQSAVPADPILSIPNITAYWKREGIDASATAQGNNVNTWTDEVAGRVLTKVGATQPTLNIASGKREVAFNGNSGMDIPEFAGIDPAGRTNAYTIIAKVGNITGTGTLIGKQTNSTDNVQYQIAYRNTGTGELGQNVGSLIDGANVNNFFARGYTAAGTLVANKVISFTVGTANNTDTVLYYDNEIVTPTLFNNPSQLTIGTITNNHPMMVGSRRNNADTSIGYSFTGSISHILVFSKKLTAGEIATIVSNLD